MRTLAALAVLLVAGAARADETWSFRFGNGDRVRGSFGGMRNGAVLVGVPAASRSVAVAFELVAQAGPSPRDPPADPPPVPQLLRLRDGAALLGHCRAIAQGKVEFDAGALGIVTIPCREIAELLPAEDAVRAYRRSIAGAATDPPPPERIDALWTRLGSPDGNVAWQAHRDLSRAGEAAVKALAARLRVQPDAPAIVAGWIRSLDADSAEVRLLAHDRLRSLGAAAEPHLRAAMRGPTSAEARQRIAALLDAQANPAPDPEVLRFVRALRVLEEIGSLEAEAILGRIADAAPDAPTGREAEAAVERLRRLR